MVQILDLRDVPKSCARFALKAQSTVDEQTRKTQRHGRDVKPFPGLESLLKVVTAW
jgi:hypothetical protein